MATASQVAILRRLHGQSLEIVSSFAHHLPSVVATAEKQFGIPIHRVILHRGLKRVFAIEQIRKLSDFRSLHSMRRWERVFTESAKHGVTLEDFQALAEKVEKRLSVIRKLTQNTYPRAEVETEEDFYG